jgi:antitoxin MazE
MKTRIIQIARSRGIRVPRALLAKARLSDEVKIEAREGVITISSASHPRAGWAKAARLAHACGEDKLLDPPTSTRFDHVEWKW